MKKVRKVSQVSKSLQAAKVQVSKVSQPAVNNGAADLTVAFRPFENSIYDMRGLLRLLDDLILIERALFRGRQGTVSFKARDFISGGVVSLFEDLEKIGLEPTTDAKQLEFVKDLVKYL